MKDFFSNLSKKDFFSTEFFLYLYIKFQILTFDIYFIFVTNRR